MRLQSGPTTSNREEIKKKSEWILKIRDRNMCELNDGCVEISIPYEFLITEFLDSIKEITKSTYPYLLNNYHDSNYLQCREILASRIEVVDDISQYIKNLFSSIHYAFHLFFRLLFYTIYFYCFYN